MEWAVASVVAARVARLATTGPDGRIDLVPITFAVLDGEDPDRIRLVTAVDHKPKSTRQLRRLDNVRLRPAVSLLVDHYDDEDWRQLWWVRVTGSARVLDAEIDRPDVSSSVDALVAKYPQYREVRPAGPVIEVTPTRWRCWSATDPGAT
jgi:PPOX class probable F420-dependent enzyme